MDKTIKLYNGDVEIEFKEKQHSYWLLDKEDLTKAGTPRKKRLKGVTSYCGIIDKSKALLPWAVDTTIEFVKNNLDKLNHMTGHELLEEARKEADRKKDEAGDIGTAIHEFADDHAKGKVPDMPENENVLEGVNNFMEWVNKYKVKFLWTERVVYSIELGFVGTADMGIEIDGKKYLLDIKTGNGVYSEVKLQTAAYTMALMEETGDDYVGRYVLRISKETEDEYYARMEKKQERYKKTYPIKPFKKFEYLFLDNDPGDLMKDYEGFKHAVRLDQWKKYADKEMKQIQD